MCSLNSVSLSKNLILLSYRGCYFNSCRNRYSTRTSVKMTVEQYQAAFYQRLLREYENDDHIVIKKCEERPTGEIAFVSIVTKMNLMGYTIMEGKRRNFQKAVVVKNLPSEEQSILFRSNAAMKNEAIAYNRIIPALQNYSVGFLPIANCIYADSSMIVLEDLCVEGFNPTSREAKGLTLKQCYIALDGLAKLHAASFVFNAREPKEFEKLASLTTEMLFENGELKQSDHQKHAIEGTIELFSSRSPSPEYRKAIQLLEDLRDNAQDKIKQLFHSRRPYSVLCHGDPWGSNIMFDEQGNLRLIDLQAMRYNSVASDLSYLLYVNLNPVDRSRNMYKLLDYYFLSLKKYMKRQDVNLDHVLTENWLKNEMATYKVYGIVYGMWVMPVFFAKMEDFAISKQNLSGAPKTLNYGKECDTRMRDFVLELVRSVP